MYLAKIVSTHTLRISLAGGPRCEFAVRLTGSCFAVVSTRHIVCHIEDIHFYDPLPLLLGRCNFVFCGNRWL